MGSLEKQLEEEYKANLGSDIRPHIVIKWAQSERLRSNFAVIKATNLMQRKGMILSCIKASYKGGASVIGYVYSEVIKPNTPSMKHGSGIVYGQDDGWFARYIGGEDTFIHRHITYGPTYASQDGEFRGRLIQWNQMLKFFDVYPDLCAEAEKLVISRLESREMEFQVDICYPSGFTARDDFEESINSSRVCIRMFILCWIVDMYEIYFEIDANHMNPGYYTKIFTQEESFHFENILSKIKSRVEYRRAILDATRITEMKKHPALLRPQVGQKIFTMSIMEAASPWNINFPFWRELYATKKCSELVLSMLTPGHPLLVDWFYITNTHAGIFETLSSHEKFAHSEQAAKIDARLKDIDDATHIDSVKSNAYVSGKFKGLSQEIWGAIHYGESFIELTDITVGMIIEHVGFTLADLPAHIVETTYPSYSSLVDDYKSHSRLQFEYLLSLYLSHYHCGVIHADLHYNNCSVFEMVRTQIASGEYTTEGYEMAYCLNGKYYSFPFNGLYGCIIDMSRSILGINMGKLVDDFGEFITSTFLRNQRDYVIEVIGVYFSDFVQKNEVSLRRALDDHMELFLRVVSAIDVLCVGENILRLVREPIIQTGSIKYDKKIGELATNISKRARELFLEGMTKLMAGNTAQIKFPALVVIEELFAEFVVGDIPEYYKKVKLNDVINADGKFDKTMERGLKSWNYSNPEFVAHLLEKDGKNMPEMYLEYVSREKKTPLVVRPDEKIGGNEMPAWMYN